MSIQYTVLGFEPGFPPNRSHDQNCLIIGRNKPTLCAVVIYAMLARA